MVGQGVRALVCITTNERAWLGGPLPGNPTSATRAQLHAWRSGEAVVGAAPAPAAGGRYR